MMSSQHLMKLAAQDGIHKTLQVSMNPSLNRRPLKFAVLHFESRSLRKDCGIIVQQHFAELKCFEPEAMPITEAALEDPTPEYNSSHRLEEPSSFEEFDDLVALIMVGSSQLVYITPIAIPLASFGGYSVTVDAFRPTIDVCRTASVCNFICS